jgi:signal transduction histidine kinase
MRDDRLASGSIDATNKVVSDPRDQRLVGMKRVAGRLAHDFKNLLVPQLGYTSLVSEMLDPSDPASVYLSKLEQTARRADAILESILLAVRPERRYSPRDLDFTALIENEVARWKGALSPTPPIAIEATLPPCTLCLDEDLWRAAISHLLSNARFALPAGGKVQVTLETSAPPWEPIAEWQTSSREGVRLSVQDTGTGMAPDVLEHALDPLFSTREKGQASGLGLTLVHSVVLLHGGQLKLMSSPGDGTNVMIWLPMGQ